MIFSASVGLVEKAIKPETEQGICVKVGICVYVCVCECVLQVWHHYFGLTKGAIWDNLKSTKWSDFSIFCFHRFSLGTWGLLLFSCLVESDSCDPMCWGPPGSSVQGISLARILQWDAISFSMGFSQPRDLTHISHLAGRCFNTEPLGKPWTWG